MLPMKFRLKAKHFKISLLFLLVFGSASAQTVDSELDCLIEPNKRIEIASPIEGIVKEIFVDRGDKVKKNALLFTLRTDEEEAAINVSKARAEFSNRAVTRNERLSDKNLISIQTRDEVETEAALAAAELESARIRHRMKSVHSPINGYVIERFKHQGEYVETDPVVTIVSIDPLYIEVVAPISYLGKIRKGDRAKITPEHDQNAHYQAMVTVVDPALDAASGTFRIRLELPNPKGKMPSGLKCGIEFL